ncbi:MAG: MiaB/RimO family radical SAM methylthiotransferase, partial [Acidobacteriota bacterium]
MRVRVDSIGCRLNIGEMEQLARRLAAAGHRIVGPGDSADLFLFNSCAVTHVASRKSRKILRQIRRENPDAAIVATGCYAELSPERCRELGVDMLVGNADKDRLPGILTDAGLLHSGDPVPEADAAPVDDVADSRTRAFVKVQDGCDNRCTFCIVTRARGDGRSRPLDDVVAEIDGLVALGYREAVLSGVHLGSWGQDLDDGTDLSTLVAAILERTEIPRLRLSSLEPWDLDEEFFGLWQDPRLLPHLHLPLQSGCDLTLARMARNTTRAEFADLVDAARRAIPGVAVSTDVIVGFFGEDDAEFEDSLG